MSHPHIRCTQLTRKSASSFENKESNVFRQLVVGDTGLFLPPSPSWTTGARGAAECAFPALGHGATCDATDDNCSQSSSPSVRDYQGETSNSSSETLTDLWFNMSAWRKRLSLSPPLSLSHLACTHTHTHTHARTHARTHSSASAHTNRNMCTQAQIHTCPHRCA